jgi:hypothetical protein
LNWTPAAARGHLAITGIRAERVLTGEPIATHTSPRVDAAAPPRTPTRLAHIGPSAAITRAAAMMKAIVAL